MECCLSQSILEAEMFARSAQSAIFVAALVIGTQAHAQAVAYGTHYDESVTTFCGFNQTYCRTNFTQLPSNYLVLVKKIHCFIDTQIPLSQAFLKVSTTSGGQALSRFVPLPITSISPQASGRYSTSIESEPEWLMGQARFPFIEVSTPSQSVISVWCTLAGDLMTPIP
jgi:hypothetical protein